MEETHEGRSRAIKVAPYYLSGGEKKAYVGFEMGGFVLNLGDTIDAWLTNGDKFSVVKFRALTDDANPWSGERVYECDFTDDANQGEWWFIVTGIGESERFYVGPDAYDMMAGHVARSFAYQTTGVRLSFPRVKNTVEGLIMGNVLTPTWEYSGTVKDGYNPYDAAAYSIANHEGAYLLNDHDAVLMTDAADMDTHVKHVDTVLGLLNTYLLQPTKYFKGQFGVPNDTPYPDIIWLALQELQVWENIQDALLHGGVPSVIQQTGS